MSNEITAERAEQLADTLLRSDSFTSRYDFSVEVATALRKLADLLRIVGPEMPCGCRAVECEQEGELLYCGVHHTDDNPMEITPEYRAWKESR